MYFSSATAERFQLNLVRWRFIYKIYHMPEISPPIISHYYYKAHTEIKVTRTIHIISYVKILRTTVADPDPYVFGPLPDPDPLVGGTDPAIIQRKK